MSKTVARVFGREFKLAAVRRMLAGENVSGLARELQIRRKYLYQWRDRFRSGGPGALRARGRPRKSEAWSEPEAVRPVAAGARRGEAELAAARDRIAALERKVGQQQVELDFFRQALRHVRAARRPIDGPGGATFTRSSKR